MATEVTAGFTSGAYGVKGEAGKSCVGVAGEGLPSAYFYVNGSTTFRQNDDGTIDFKVNSVSLSQNHINNIGWPANPFSFTGLRVSRSYFQLVDGPDGPTPLNEPFVTNGGTMTHTGANDAECYGTFSGNGYHRIANNIQQLGSNGSNVGVYVLGLVEYGSIPTTTVIIPSIKVTFTSTGTPTLDTFFDYYPWERRLNETWKSLNREGGKSTTAGLFRKQNGLWVPCTNRVGTDTSNDHAFRYNNGWKKSPKSGQGAI